MHPIRVRPAALADLTDAWLWYESQREGLGDEFRACIDVAMAEIARSPLTWRTVHGNVRRRIVRRFPYAVLYLAEP
jgi:plasmid stabilization system protein ParE